MPQLTQQQARDIANQIVTKAGQDIANGDPKFNAGKKRELRNALEQSLQTADIENVLNTLDSDDFIQNAADALDEQKIVFRKEGRNSHVSVATENLQNNVMQSLQTALNAELHNEVVACENIVSFMEAVVPESNQKQFREEFDKALEAEKQKTDTLRRPRDVYLAASNSAKQTIVKELSAEIGKPGTPQEKDMAIVRKEMFSNALRDNQAWLQDPVNNVVQGMEKTIGGLLTNLEGISKDIRGRQGDRSYQDVQEEFDIVRGYSEQLEKVYDSRRSPLEPKAEEAFKASAATKEHLLVAYEKAVREFEESVNATLEDFSLTEKAEILSDIDDIMHPERIADEPHSKWDPYTQIQYLIDEKIKGLDENSPQAKAIKDIGKEIVKMEKSRLRTVEQGSTVKVNEAFYDDPSQFNDFDGQYDALVETIKTDAWSYQNVMGAHGAETRKIDADKTLGIVNTIPYSAENIVEGISQDVSREVKSSEMHVDMATRAVAAYAADQVGNDLNAQEAFVTNLTQDQLKDALAFAAERNIITPIKDINASDALKAYETGDSPELLAAAKQGAGEKIQAKQVKEKQQAREEFATLVQENAVAAIQEYAAHHPKGDKNLSEQRDYIDGINPAQMGRALRSAVRRGDIELPDTLSKDDRNAIIATAVENGFDGFKKDALQLTKLAILDAKSAPNLAQAAQEMEARKQALAEAEAKAAPKLNEEVDPLVQQVQQRVELDEQVHGQIKEGADLKNVGTDDRSAPKLESANEELVHSVVERITSEKGIAGLSGDERVQFVQDALAVKEFVAENAENTVVQGYEDVLADLDYEMSSAWLYNKVEEHVAVHYEVMSAEPLKRRAVNEEFGFDDSKKEMAELRKQSPEHPAWDALDKGIEQNNQLIAEEKQKEASPIRGLADELAQVHQEGGLKALLRKTGIDASKQLEKDTIGGVAFVDEEHQKARQQEIKEHETKYGKVDLKKQAEEKLAVAQVKAEVTPDALQQKIAEMQARKALTESADVALKVDKLRESAKVIDVMASGLESKDKNSFVEKYAPAQSSDKPLTEVEKLEQKRNQQPGKGSAPGIPV